jgi:RHS repeat-associated protein
MGSTTVTVMGSSAVRMGEMWMSCGEPLRLPSSVVIAIPKGPLVLIGGPPGVNLMDALLGMIKTKWVAGYAHSLISRIKSDRLRNIFTKVACFLTGHPVDVASGRLLTDNVDFELPGPLPLKFERHYASSWSHRDGPLGPGWSHSLDQAVWSERGKLVYLAEDGREIEFDVFDFPDHMLQVGQEVYDPMNQLTLRFRSSNLIQIETHHGELFDFSPLSKPTPGGRSHWWRLQRQRTRDGHEISLAYDDRGDLQWVRDSAGRIVGFEHDAQHRLIRVLLPHPTVDGFIDHLRYSYDAEGDLVRVTDALGAAWTFAYKRHLMVRETDRNGLSFYFAYDGWGSDAYCVRTWGDGGLYDHVIDYAKGTQTVVSNSLGHRTMYKLNPIGQVVEVVDPLGGSRKYEYDPATLRKNKEVTPLGAEVLLEYDSRGNIVSTTDEAGDVTKLTYNRFNLGDVIEKPTGVWRWTFDGQGHPTESINPCDEVTRYIWVGGFLSGIRGPDETATALTYDSSGNLTDIQLPDGEKVHYEHDRLGRMVRSASSQGLVTQIEYDALSRPRRLSQLGAHVVDLTYDAEGRTIASNINGEQVRYTYSGFRLIERHNADGTSVKLRYDTEERLIALTNENGETWTFELDQCGSPSRETSFDGRTVHYERGKAREVTAIVAASGRKTNLAYDKAARLVAVEHTDGTSRLFEYGPGGVPLATVSNGSRLEWKRDAMGRVVQESQDGQTVERTFANGRPTSLRSTLGIDERVHWVNGHVSALMLQAGDPRSAIRFTRGAGGSSRTTVAPNATQSTWSHAPTGRPIANTTSGPGRLREQRLEWRSPDHVQRIVDTQTGPLDLDHDQRGRLLGMRSAWSSQGFVLDGVGNRQFATRDWHYELGGRLLQAGSLHFRYDEDGNLVEKRLADGSSWTFEWFGNGRLRLAKAPDGRIVSFNYDALARRTKKRVARVDAEGNETVEHEVTYVWNGPQLIHELGSDGDLVTWHWGPNAQSPIARSQDGRTLTFVHDHLGTPIEAFDEQGRLVWEMRLDSFGRATISGDRGLCPWRWPGQYADEETGLYYNHFRYFDPDVGRYVSPDPINLFASNAVYNAVVDPWAQFDFNGLQANHHPIPNQLVEQMADEGILDGKKLGNFDSTQRPGLWPLSDAKGAHAHSQAHEALSDFLNEKHGLDMRRGTQNADDWAKYLAERDTLRKITNDLDEFYEKWLPAQVKAGKYPLLVGEMPTAKASYRAERERVHGCKK